MASPLLEAIDLPADLRKLSRESLDALAQELRAFLIESVSKTGGQVLVNVNTCEVSPV